LLRVFQRFFDRDPLHSAFGRLELEVMAIVWTDADLSVRDVHMRFRRPVAYTTVMTTLDRLYKKGVLSRVRSGRAFRYSAAVSREELKGQIANRVITGLLQDRGPAAVPLLSNLIDTVSAQDGGEDLLRTLEDMVREKRRRLKRG
jgi:predicted transcriptional regulator